MSVRDLVRSADRRAVLKAALGGAAGLALPSFAGVAFGQSSGASLTALTPKLGLIGGAGANILALGATDGMVLVDSGAPGTADAVRNALGDLPGPGRVATLFNTHYHADQTGNNAAFGEAGATIIAHQKTKQWLSTDYYVPWEDSWVEAQPEAAWPTETFYTGGEMTVGGEAIEYGHLLFAHTAGDIYVYFRDANVLAVGDVASPVRDPEFDWFTGGWLGGRVDAMEKLLTLANDDTKIVPSFGPVMTKAELQAETDMMNVLWERAFEALTTGRSAEDMLNTDGALDGLGREFDDPATMLYDIMKGMQANLSSVAYQIV